MSDLSSSHSAQAAPLGLEQLQAILAGVEILPAGPAVADRAVALAALSLDGANRADACAQLAQLAAVDAGMAFNLLSAAGADASTLQAATAQVGEAALADLALSALPADAGVASCSRLARHSLLVALATREIAAKTPLEVDADRAYLAGLLHDIGKLALCQVMPRSYQRVLAAAQSGHWPLVQLERRLLGADHAAAGHLLCQLRNLPLPYAQAAWLHHQPAVSLPAQVAAPRLVMAVALANELAHQVSDDQDAASADRIGDLASRLGLDQAAPDALAQRLPDLLDRALARLGLGDDPTAEALSARRAEAITILSRRNRQLHAQQAGGHNQAHAMERVGPFTRRLASQSSGYDVLVAAGDMLSAAAGAPCSAVHPLIAYAIDRQAGRVTAVRCDGAARPPWRSLPMAAPLRDQTAPPAPGQAPAVLGRLLEDPSQLDDWLDAQAAWHQPMVSSGAWLGGAFLPRDPAGPARPALTSLVDLAGLALSLVQARSQAAQLNEELLAGAQVLSATQEALAQSRMLAGVGQMAAGAGHEMNNPLAIISGKAQLMASRCAADADRQAWDSIIEQAQRLSDIITELMQFASPPAPRASDIAPADLLEDVKKAFAASGHPQAARVRVDIEMGEGVSLIRADRDQVLAALLEAVANAANAADAPMRVVLSAATAGQAVRLTVRDDGPGMDGPTLQRAFTPFFSHQRAGRRRGLGLPKARRWIQNNGGRMWIRSRPGRGTCVVCELPVPT